MISMFSEKELDDEKDVWAFREDFTRGTLKNIVNFKEEERDT